MRIWLDDCLFLWFNRAILDVFRVFEVFFNHEGHEGHEDEINFNFYYKVNYYED